MVLLLPAPFLVQQGALRSAIRHSGMSRVGLSGFLMLSEGVKWYVVATTSSRPRTRDRGLRDHPGGEVPHVSSPVRVIMDVSGLLERKHEAVDQDRGYANCY